MSARCKCAPVKVGGRVTETRNWNPDCPVHGVKSKWYNSLEQVKKREENNARLRDLQMQARQKRQEAARERAARDEEW